MLGGVLVANRGRVPSFYGYRAWENEFAEELNTPKNFLYKPKGVPRARETPKTFLRPKDTVGMPYRRRND